MTTVAKMKEHFQSLVDKKAVYVWGGNCQVITEELMETLYKSYGNNTYDKNYYNKKLQEGKGRIAADCSGSFKPVSGYDTTANSYYSNCISKGTIKTLPKDKPCMVFIKQGNRMVHIGWYDGNGKVYEMRSSAMNVRYDALSDRWTHWGIPEFVDYTVSTSKIENTIKQEDVIVIELNELKSGSKGAQVKTLQRLLIAMGYSCGSTGVDGDFGAKTLTAVRTFQRKKGLTVDGIVGKNTWNALLK